MDLLQSIGKTPLIRLAKLTAGLDAEILVKVESRNPGGSIKDQLSIDACNEHGIAMVFCGMRHFKH